MRWLPLHVEVARNGSVVPPSRTQQCQQFLSVATDANVLVWDVRSAVPEKETYQRRHLKLLGVCGWVGGWYVYACDMCMRVACVRECDVYACGMCAWV